MMLIKHALALTPDKSDPLWLLAHVLKKDRGFLTMFPEHVLTMAQEKLFLSQLERLTQGEPLAYIVGEQSFHNIILTVTPDVLIPRSETELLVEFVLNYFSGQKNSSIADLGTGSGAIALALATAQPDWEIHATDISEAALNIAKTNAARLKMKSVTFHQGDWCDALPNKKFSAIISNPPYIAADDPALDDSVRHHEPPLALFAEEQGLSAIKKIINTAKNYLAPNGLLIIEHGYQQSANVKELMTAENYSYIKTYPDFANHDRFTIGQ